MSVAKYLCGRSNFLHKIFGNNINYYEDADVRMRANAADSRPTCQKVAYERGYKCSQGEVGTRLCLFKCKNDSCHQTINHTKQAKWKWCPQKHVSNRIVEMACACVCTNMLLYYSTHLLEIHEHVQVKLYSTQRLQLVYLMYMGNDRQVGNPEFVAMSF